jgi:hypothetical protein
MMNQSHEGVERRNSFSPPVVITPVVIPNTISVLSTIQMNEREGYEEDLAGTVPQHGILIFFFLFFKLFFLFLLSLLSVLS